MSSVVSVLAGSGSCVVELLLELSALLEDSIAAMGGGEPPQAQAIAMSRPARRIVIPAA
jgi:hypothetical protein